MEQESEVGGGSGELSGGGEPADPPNLLSGTTQFQSHYHICCQVDQV